MLRGASHGAVGLCLGTMFPEVSVGCLRPGTSDPPPFLSSPPADLLPIPLPRGCGQRLPWQRATLLQPHSPDPQLPARVRPVLGGPGGPNWTLCWVSRHRAALGVGVVSL